jgi:hypothetical protein
MENFDKIIELLEKKNLSFEDEKALEMYRKDAEAADFIKGYRQLKRAIEKSHISTDELGDYILALNSSSPYSAELTYRMPAIRAHLKECTLCAGEFETLNQEYSSLEKFLNENLYSEKKSEVQTSPTVQRRSWNRPVYAFAGIIIIGLIYLGLFTVSGIITPDTYKFAAVNQTSEDYLTRGRNTELFLKSFDAIESKDYKNAVRYLQQDIRHNINDETIFYSHYILGLTYLEMAEHRVLGLFPSYDQQSAKEGIASLKQSIDLNTSGRFDNIRLDAYFYLAKGNLMLNNRKAAEEYLKLVISQKGGKMKEAADMLRGLE